MRGPCKILHIIEFGPTRIVRQHLYYGPMWALPKIPTYLQVGFTGYSGIVTRNLYLATVMLTTEVPTKTFITVLKKYIYLQQLL
jgi:hypothetical protein